MYKKSKIYFMKIYVTGECFCNIWNTHYYIKSLHSALGDRKQIIKIKGTT